MAKFAAFDMKIIPSVKPNLAENFKKIGKKLNISAASRVEGKKCVCISSDNELLTYLETCFDYVYCDEEKGNRKKFILSVP